MIFNHKALLSALLLVASSVQVAGNLRASGGRRLSTDAECTIMIAELLLFDPEQQEEEGEIYECELDPFETGGIPGLSYPLEMTKEQKKEMKQLVKEGFIVASESTLHIGGATWDKTGEKVKLPGNMKIKDKVNNGNAYGMANKARRNLAILTGDKPSEYLAKMNYIFLFEKRLL